MLSCVTLCQSGMTGLMQVMRAHGPGEVPGGTCPFLTVTVLLSLPTLPVSAGRRRAGGDRYSPTDSQTFNPEGKKIHGCQLTCSQEQLLMSQGRWPDRQEEPRGGLAFAEGAISKLWPVVEQQTCACGDLGLHSRLGLPRAVPWSCELCPCLYPCPCLCLSQGLLRASLHRPLTAVISGLLHAVDTSGLAVKWEQQAPPTLVRIS